MIVDIKNRNGKRKIMYIYEYDRDRNNIFYIAVETRVSVRMHFHNCMELIYVLDGEAVAHIDDVTYPLTSGQLCAVSCFSTHYYENLRDGQYMVCLVPRRYFRDYESIFNVNSFRTPIVDDIGDKPFLNILRIMENIINDRNVFGEPMSNVTERYRETQLYFLSSYLVNLLINHCGLHERHRISSLVADAVRIIENNFKGNLTTADICKKTGCYQKNLSHHFKKTMNMSIINYIERTRALEAARLLNTNPKMTVETVMLESGFKSNRSFLRHFKNIYGCTPTEYKNRQNSHLTDAKRQKDPQ